MRRSGRVSTFGKTEEMSFLERVSPARRNVIGGILLLGLTVCLSLSLITYDSGDFPFKGEVSENPGRFPLSGKTFRAIGRFCRHCFEALSEEAVDCPACGRKA